MSRPCENTRPWIASLRRPAGTSGDNLDNLMGFNLAKGLLVWFPLEVTPSLSSGKTGSGWMTA